MSICPSYIGARRIRVTRLDRCGRPVYGPCSQIVSDGFISIEFSPDVEEGEEYTQRNANGDLCVSERGQDALRWINVAIEFCRVDAELWQIMNPTWKTVTNAQGEVTGFEIGEKFSDTEGFALEVWPKATGQSTLCDDDAPEDAVPNGYFLLPYVVGGAPESWTLEDGVATFTLNGRTKKGSLWGRGPYNITHDAQGNPTPLLRPIDSGAQSGNPTHFHANIVTLAPPEPACGCQALEALPPGAEGGQITVSPQQPNEACFTVSGSSGRQATIDWGDDSPAVTSRVGREECHLYTAVGTYTVTVADIDDPTKSNTYTVDIAEVPALENPTISATVTNPTVRGVTLTVDNHGNGQVTVDWGDGTAVQTLDGNMGDGQPIEHPHAYAAAGTYTITVTAVEDDRATATTEVTFAAPAPDAPTNLAVNEANATATMLPVTWDYTQGQVAADGFEVRYRAVGEESWATNPVNDPTAREYNTPPTLTPETTYEVQVRATTDAGGVSSWTASATGSTVADPGVPAIMASPGEGVAPLDVRVTVDNHGQGQVTVDWGDGTATGTNPGDGIAESTHTYTAAGTYTLAVTDTDDATRTDSVEINVTAPTPAALAATVTPTEGTTTTSFVLLADNDGQGPVDVDWGDGTATATNPGDATTESTHTYATAGTYTVTAADADDATRTDSVEVTVS